MDPSSLTTTGINNLKIRQFENEQPKSIQKYTRASAKAGAFFISSNHCTFITDTTLMKNLLLAAGIYTWRIVSPPPPEGGLNTNNAEVIKTGKIAKE